MSKQLPKIDSFNFQPGRILAGKYVVNASLGAGWEGEVYKVTERKTGIRRAAKVFYPQRNARDRAVNFYARKLNRLRKCPVVIQYHNSETIRYHGTPITCLISELVEGELLSRFIRRRPGKRLAPFEALHLLHALTIGIEQIHAAGEYHGDLHDDNVLVERHGIRFEVKVVDFYHWGPPTAATRRDDIVNLVRILYDAVGGRSRYASQPPEIKAICLGLRRDLILRNFPSTARLRRYLETFVWEKP